MENQFDDNYTAGWEGGVAATGQAFRAILNGFPALAGSTPPELHEVYKLVQQARLGGAVLDNVRFMLAGLDCEPLPDVPELAELGKRLKRLVELERLQADK